jgi:S-DNA-T family DNA segregation ATPase FtsK/SpoIIIE
LFNRQPRLRTPLSTERVKIPAPPNIPAPPSGVSWLTIGLPLIATLLSVVLMLSVVGGSTALSFLIFIPIMIATALASVLQAWLQKRDYRKQIAAAQQEYTIELQQVIGSVQTLWQTEQQLRTRNAPDFATCLQQAESQAARLGERRPSDDDFLAIRIGTGAVPAAFQVEAPEVNPRPKEFASHLVLADQIVQDYAQVAKCPLELPLRSHSGIGFVGARQEVAPVVRAFAAQTATFHWLSEVQFLVIAPQQARAEWQFLATLPHGREWWNRGASARSGGSGNTERLAALEAELQKRQQLFYANQLKSGGAANKHILPFLIVIVDHVHTTPAPPALKLLLEKGRELGAAALFVVERITDVPSECSAVVQVNGANLRYRATGPEGKTWNGDADSVTVPQIERLATALANIDWLREEDVSQPPDKVTFLNMLGADSLEQLDVFSWWEGDYPYGYLRAPIGKTSRDADLIFDLNDTDGAHGPHGLIGGMTGSGKSELLRTIVLALALTHHPYDLNFALIDYKGGATFNDLDQLPHTVGVITDIETYASYGERVILSLTAEIERRKRIVEQAKNIFGFGRSHIDEYRKLPVRRPLPRLVVIFDEFASFKQKHPEESKMLIDIARQGRSLGVHMILATQNPRSAVDDQVRQNSTFRIALRVSEPSDSNELIGIPDAAFLTRGRAYFFVRAPLLFQVAYGGAPYYARKLPDDAIVRILADNRREILYPLDWNLSAPAAPNAIQETESQAILARILSVAETMALQKLAPVWQEPLPERLYLPRVLHDLKLTSWDGKQWVPLEDVTPLAVIGKRDEPARQRQEYAVFNPIEQGGHILIFGAPGTGKSVLLQTIALSLAMSHTPEQVNLYIADLAGQPMLNALQPLPHVGAVIRPNESERIERLFKLLRAEIERRSELLRQTQAGTIAAYNARAADKRIPYTFVLIDDFGKLKNDYSDYAREVSRLANEGRPLGIYFIITANTDDNLYADLLSNIPYKLTFKQEQSKYASLVGYVSEQRAENEFGPQPHPGRGFLRGNPPLLFQAALPVAGEDDAKQIANLNQIVQAMHQAWRGILPEPVRTLRRIIPLAEFASHNAENGWRLNGSGISSYSALIGQEYDSLRPCEIEMGSDGQIFMVIALNPRLGKTTTLRTFALSLAERYSPAQVNFIFFDQHKRVPEPLSNLPHTLPTPRRKDQTPRIVEKLRAEVERRRAVLQDPSGELTGAAFISALGPALVLFIDDYPDFMNEFGAETDLQKELLDILNKAREVNVYLVLSGNLGEMPGYQDALLQRARSDGSGVLLSSREGIDSYKNARLPQTFAEFPPGRGYFLRRGQPRLIQVAAYFAKNDKPNDMAAFHARRIANFARQQNIQAQWQVSEYDKL